MLQSDVARKPQGHIALDGQTRTTKTEGGVTFEVSFLASVTVHIEDCMPVVNILCDSLSSAIREYFYNTDRVLSWLLLLCFQVDT